MRQITLNIPNEQYRFFMKLVRNLPFVQVAKTAKIADPKLTAEEQEWVDGLRGALQEVEERELGQRQLLSAGEFLKKHASNK